MFGFLTLRSRPSGGVELTGIYPVSGALRLFNLIGYRMQEMFSSRVLAINVSHQ